MRITWVPDYNTIGHNLQEVGNDMTVYIYIYNHIILYHCYKNIWINMHKYEWIQFEACRSLAPVVASRKDGLWPGASLGYLGTHTSGRHLDVQKHLGKHRVDWEQKWKRQHGTANLSQWNFATSAYPSEKSPRVSLCFSAARLVLSHHGNSEDLLQ